MPTQTVTQSTQSLECPECAGRITVGQVLQGEILSCPDCGADLEIRTVTPHISVALAPPVEEDWGE